MKITAFHAENIKKLKVVDITPKGNVVQITGPNGSGKTSVLDSIYWAIAGTKEIPSQPIRQGQTKAVIKLSLGEVTVTRRFTEKGTTIIVESKDGARFPSPQKMLDELMGSMTFDPLAFMRLDAKKQLEELRGLVKLDINIDALDAQNALDYQKRTDVNREVKSLQSRIEALPDYSDVPADPVDISKLIAEMENGAKNNENIGFKKVVRQQEAQKISMAREDAQRKLQVATDLRAEPETIMADAEKEATRIIDAAKSRCQKIKEEADKRETEALELDEVADKRQSELDSLPALPDPVDFSAIKQRIEDARQLNLKVEAAAKGRQLEADWNKATDDADKLTKAIEDRDTKKREAIARAKMPVKALSFGNGEVIFNGLPLNQASDAEQLRVSIAIAMAANPKLRVLRIRDGSLLDDKSLAAVASMADHEDYQVWIERVDSSGKVGIHMEDGEVANVQNESKS